MNYHIIGSLTPNPSPNGRKRSLEWGTSLAVLQWMELIRGERAVQAPSNPFRVEMVKAEENYCLQCFGVRWFDVVYGSGGQGSGVRVKRCRCCGKESGG